MQENALRMAMAIVDIVEGYDNYADAMDAIYKSSASICESS